MQQIKQCLAGSSLFAEYSYGLMGEKGMIIRCLLGGNFEPKLEQQIQALYLQMTKDLEMLYLTLK